MTILDDPAIPDDLSGLLRSGSADLPVAPAELGSIQRRARQRRRRRHGLVAAGAAAVVLLAGLASIGLTDDGGDRVVTATAAPAPRGSVPQPLLIPHTMQVDEVPAGADPTALGGSLDDVAPTGTTTWWTTEGAWYPTSAFVLADGRRFGIAATNPPQRETPTKARLDEIGADGTTVASTPLRLDAPSGSSAWIRAIGATGNELVVQRMTESLPDPDLASRPEGQRLDQSASYAAIDVDTGAERALTGPDGRAAAAAAGDTLVLAPGTDCTLVVTTLAGADRRTFDAGCGGTVPGLGGLASEIELSPDGRYVAGTWMTISTSGPGSEVLTVVDLETGTVLLTRSIGTGATNQGLAWTGEREVTVAERPGIAPITWDGDGVTIRSIPWDAERATATARATTGD